MPVRLILTATVATAFIASAAGAGVLLSNFETNTPEGWQTWSNPHSVQPDPSGGSAHSLKLDIGNQYWGEYSLPNWANAYLTIANVNANDKLEFDAYFPSTGWLQGTVEARVRLQTNLQDLSTAAQVISVAPKDSMLHFAMDYSALPDLTSPADYLNLHLYLTPGYGWQWDSSNPSFVAYAPQTVYLDNVQLTQVPEPAALAFVPLAVAATLLRPRRDAAAS